MGVLPMFMWVAHQRDLHTQNLHDQCSKKCVRAVRNATCKVLLTGFCLFFKNIKLQNLIIRKGVPANINLPLNRTNLQIQCDT